MMAAQRQQSQPMTLDLLLEGFAHLQQSVPVLGISSDSRQVQPGGVFVALAGGSYHGLDFLDQVLAVGPAAVLADADDDRFDAACRQRIERAGAVAMALPELAERLSAIATRFHAAPAVALAPIAVTGTDGKTSVSQFIAAALDEPDARCGVIGTLGNGLPDQLAESEFTTPDAIGLQAALADLRDAGARRVAMEVSSHALALGRLEGLPVDVAVLTNLGRDHLDFHGTLEDYREAKARLFDWPGLRCRVLNLDDEFGRALLAAPRADVTDLSYSASGAAAADFAAEQIRRDASGLSFTVRTPHGRVDIRSGLLGHFNVDNLLAAFAALSAAGLAGRDIAERLSRLTAVAGRLERFTATGAPSVVVDYAHTPQALSAALEALRPHCAGKLWCLFGCGGDRDRGKRPLMAQAAEAGADRVIVCDDNPRTEDAEAIVADIMAGFAASNAVLVERDRASAIRSALEIAGANDWLLVAGKGHENYQIIGREKLHYSDRDTVRALLAGVGQ